MGHTWIGTTDTDFDDDPATASATDEDVRYLIESLASQLPPLRTAKRHWTTAGVRALVRSDGSPSGVSRMHRITTETSGLVSVLGGKLTGYRAIAEEVVDRVCRELQVSARSTTATTPLPGGGPGRSGVPHLDAIYGSRAPRVQALADADPALARPLAPGHPDIAAEVVLLGPTRVVRFASRTSCFAGAIWVSSGDRGESARRRIGAALTAVGPQA